MKHLAVVLILALCCASYSEAQIGYLGGICDYYSGVLKISNSALVGTVVNATLIKILSNSSIIQYFNGVQPAGSPNFVGNVTAQGILFTHLVQFFGQSAVFNCTDGTIAAYQGLPLVTIHSGLGINFVADSTFNQILLGVLTGAGVAATDVAIVATALDSFRASICYATDCTSICNKYSLPGVTSNLQLVTQVIGGVLTAAINPANGLLQFFNGTVPPGSPNFVANATANAILTAHLIQFFGAALGCSDGTIGGYQGNPMSVAHANIPINNATFEGFNGAVIAVLKGMGVSAADLASVMAVLEGARVGICNQADCFAPTVATTAAVTTATKAAAFNVAPIFALIALLAYLFL